MTRSLNPFARDGCVVMVRMRRMPETFHEPEWHILEARLQAFGTADVFAAAQKLSTANIDASHIWTF